MSWRDRTRPARFRNAPFFVDASELTEGAHHDIQNFPGHRDPVAAVNVEHLGAGPRRWKLKGFVAGADYDRARDRLRDALRRPGPGVLVHPLHGRKRVSVVGQVRVTESTKKGGAAFFTFDVVEHEPPPPAALPATVRAPARAAAAAASAAVDVGAIEAAPPGTLSAIGKYFDAAMSLGADAYDTVAGGLGQLDVVSLRAGQLTSLAGRFEALPGSAIASVGSVVHELFDAVIALRDLPEHAVDGAIAAFAVYKDALAKEQRRNPPRNITEQRARRQLRDLSLGAWLTGVVSLAGAARYRSRRHALDIRGRLDRAIDDFVREGIASDATVAGANLHAAFESLRASMAARMDEVAATLPELRRYVVPAPVPALVLAQQLYGDPSRADDIIARNHIPNPGLIEAGTTLEVPR